MNLYPYLILILGAIALTLFLIVRDKKGSVEALLLKTITSFLFISLAFASYMVNSSHSIATFFMLIMMGLICGLIGDIVLDLKIMYPESNSLYQHGGMIAFFIGHLFYITALIVYFGFNWIPLVIAIVLGVIINAVSKFVLKFNFKEHTIDCYAYSFILAYFMTQACYSAFSVGFTASTVLLGIGSILFLLSDLILVMTYYDHKDAKVFIVSNHVLYYAAQFLLAISVLYMVA